MRARGRQVGAESAWGRLSAAAQGLLGGGGTGDFLKAVLAICADHAQPAVLACASQVEGVLRVESVHACALQTVVT